MDYRPRNIHCKTKRKRDVAQAGTARCRGCILYSGKIHLFSRKIDNSLTKGSCTILSAEAAGDNDAYLDMVFENEILSAVLKTKGQDDKYLSLAPDMIDVSYAFCLSPFTLARFILRNKSTVSPPFCR
jgi:DUF917 family protein